MKQILPYFSQTPLERFDSLKEEESKINSYIDSSKSVFVFFEGTNIYIDKNAKEYFFKRDIIDKYKIDTTEVVFLGKYKEQYYFAITLKQNSFLSKIGLREFTSFDFCEEKNLGIIAQACSLLSWHDSHKFCASCGEKTVFAKLGARRDCPICKKEHFPRIDPVVIMLVTSGDYCLLGQGVNFVENRYSCLAGYVEAGESFENAALRELYEEVAVKGKNVKYISSQPWPFPSTLMVGMKVEAISKELNIDKNEINDAMWVHKDELKMVLKGESTNFTLPGKFAIARNLLEYWLEDEL